MSDRAPDVDAYVYQPDSPSKGDRIYAVGGIPPRLTKEEAEAIVDAINGITWMCAECAYCGHVARFASSSCPQCSRDTPASWRDVEPESRCDCERCSA